MLKKTSKQELDIYDTFLSFAKLGVPRFYKSIEYDGELFILMEYLDGNNLQKCDRKSLTAVLDALIYLQNIGKSANLKVLATALKRVYQEGKNGGNISMT